MYKTTTRYLNLSNLLIIHSHSVCSGRTGPTYIRYKYTHNRGKKFKCRVHIYYNDQADHFVYVQSSYVHTQHTSNQSTNNKRNHRNIKKGKRKKMKKRKKKKKQKTLRVRRDRPANSTFLNFKIIYLT